MGEIRPRPTSRAIYRALTLLGSAQGIGMICSLLRNKLIAIWVGQSGIALVGILNSVVEMIGTLSQQGLRTSAVGQLSAVASTPRFGSLASVVASCGTIIGIVCALLMLIFSPLLSRISFGSGDYTIAFAIAAIAVLLNSIAASHQAILQGSGRLARIARASLIGSIVGLIVSVPLLWWLRLTAIPWIIVVYSAVTTAAYIFPRLQLCHIPLRETIIESAAILRLGLWLTLSSAVGWAVSYLFMAWLHARGGSDAVGLYQCGSTIAIRYMGILFSAIALEFYPRLARRAGHSAAGSAILIAHETGIVLRIAFPAALILIIFSQLAINILYSSEFTAATPFMTGALAATPLRALSWCAAFMIVARGDGRAFLLVETASGLICFGLSAWLYTLVGYAGLGAAYILWYLIYSIIVITVCRRRYAMQLPTRTLSAVSITTLLLASAALIVNLC